MKITMDAAAQMLRDAQTVVLTSHIRPDGDAIGSTLGLMHVLRAQGKEVRVLIDDEIPRIFSILPGVDQIECPIESQRYTADLLVVCDVELGRTGASVSAVDAVRLLNIDHHVTNDEKAEHLCLNPKAAATCEIVYDLVRILGVMPMLDAAVCLYTGMATDTGFFRFSNTTAHAMRMGARLLEAGVIPNEVSETLEMKPLDVVMGQAKALETLEFCAEGRVAGIFLEKAFADKIESTEGFIDLIRVIEGVEIAVLIKEIEERHCRVSIRSKGINVSEIAVRFGGGGHIRAAGCTLNMTLAEAKAALLPALAEAVEKRP